MLKSVKGFMQKWRLSMSKSILQSRLQNKGFTIISNDCWGGEVYKNLNLPYNTPFVGVMMMAPCYITLLQDIKQYLSQSMNFVSVSKYEHLNKWRVQNNLKYPIGLLSGNIEIHFLHYHSEIEAKEKWERRCARINWNNIFLKFDSNKDLSTTEYLMRFDQLSYPKVALGIDIDNKIKSSVTVRNWNQDGAKMFDLSLRNFDVIDWLNKGSGKVNWFGKLSYFIFHKKN